MPFVCCLYICSTYPNIYYNYSLQYFPVHSCCYPCWSNNCLHANASMEQGRDDTIVYSRRGCAIPVLCSLYILCFYTFRFNTVLHFESQLRVHNTMLPTRMTWKYYCSYIHLFNIALMHAHAPQDHWVALCWLQEGSAFTHVNKFKLNYKNTCLSPFLAIQLWMR